MPKGLAAAPPPEAAPQGFALEAPVPEVGFDGTEDGGALLVLDVVAVAVAGEGGDGLVAAFFFMTRKSVDPGVTTP